MAEDQPSREIDPEVPHSARIWNYWLGGKDNYEADRRVGDQISRDVFPGIINTARQDRAFLGRAVHYLVEQAGVRQFLDIGTGLPTVDNTHEVAQSIAPECKIVYVDNDPLVLAHAAALLTARPPGVATYVDADLDDPGAIIAAAARTLDLTRPVAIMLLGIMHFVADDDRAGEILRLLLDAVPPGSHIAIAHATEDLVDADQVRANIELWNEHGTPKMRSRTRAEILRLFDGLELVEPGVVSYSRWRPPHSPFGRPDLVPGLCGVGRKP
ncbi:SAM-dependent methyltransferase [Actinomadura meridiana]|uniref:SAM-dependent methyltransferase n=1 Tax=Actinomadura meridiana TaxID=559626 RepID=A0ABP8BRY7_9ACTN